MINVNTTSVNSTHFLRAVELIENARTDYKVSSENWPHPTTYRLGTPCEEYYAEIWVDGMDWQPSYWIIEEKNLKDPQIRPFIIFERNEERERFQDYDFEQLIKGSMWFRRDKYWIKSNDLGAYTDISWPYLQLILETNGMFALKHKELIKVSFEHASQLKVDFWMNEDFIPEYLFRRKNEEDRNSGNQEKRQSRSL
jgi:hypothetical protein